MFGFVTFSTPSSECFAAIYWAWAPIIICQDSTRRLVLMFFLSLSRKQTSKKTKNDTFKITRPRADAKPLLLYVCVLRAWVPSLTWPRVADVASGRIQLLHTAQNVRRLHTASNLARRGRCLYIVLQIRSVAGAILDVTVTASRP